MSTTVLDAYIGPLMSEYLERLEQLLRDHGFRGSFLVMRMDGAVQPAALVRLAPVAALQSGPVAGVAASRGLGARLGHPDVITADVGGTSFDVGLVVDGDVRYLPRPMVDRLPLALPVVDVTSIGTGGGSIVWIDDRLGALRVGPDSAGRDARDRSATPAAALARRSRTRRRCSATSPRSAATCGSTSTPRAARSRSTSRSHSGCRSSAPQPACSTSRASR